MIYIFVPIIIFFIVIGIVTTMPKKQESQYEKDKKAAKNKKPYFDQFDKYNLDQKIQEIKDSVKNKGETK